MQANPQLVAAGAGAGSGAGAGAAAATAAAAAAAAAAKGPPPFGLVVPGRPMRVDFVRTAADRYVLNILRPQDVAELCFFTMPGVPIPAGMGVVVYWAVPPCTSWDVLGIITSAKPSVSLRTNWKGNHSVLTATHVSIGLKIESAEGLKIVAQAADGYETSQLDFAMQVARDLYNYMGSFSKTIAGTEGILVPTNILDRWMTRFKTKYLKDATFLKKKSTG